MYRRDAELKMLCIGVYQSEAAVEGNVLGRDSPQDLSSLFFGPYDKGRYQT
jgi:hypothetical protein